MSKFHEAILQETQTPMLSAGWWFAASQGNEMDFAFTVQSTLVLSIRLLALQSSFQALFHKRSSHGCDCDCRDIEGLHDPLVWPAHLYIRLQQNLGSLHLSSRPFSRRG